MPAKVQRGERFRRVVLIAAALAAWPLAAAAPRAAEIRGRLTLLDRGNRPGQDVGQAIVWLEGRGGRVAPVQAEISTADKAFSPHVLVVPAGSTVAFPNHDPFNHNVFSLSEELPFDLGLYGRGEARSIKVERPGIVRVYCNVHAQMSALIVVRDGPWFAQPSGDGSFTLPDVPAGRYVLHAWHERASEVNRPLNVPAAGLTGITLELDARGYRFKPHLNKFGQPYPQQGRRY
ncbi:MAG: plastocyanin/azurin family copper-binding protein [Gemmatimonadales bacterium]